MGLLRVDDIAFGNATLTVLERNKSKGIVMETKAMAITDQCIVKKPIWNLSFKAAKHI
jgi:hypothetical protein